MCQSVLEDLLQRADWSFHVKTMRTIVPCEIRFSSGFTLAKSAVVILSLPSLQTARRGLAREQFTWSSPGKEFFIHKPIWVEAHLLHRAMEEIHVRRCASCTFGSAPFFSWKAGVHADSTGRRPQLRWRQNYFSPVSGTAGPYPNCLGCRWGPGLSCRRAAWAVALSDPDCFDIRKFR